MLILLSLTRFGATEHAGVAELELSNLFGQYKYAMKHNTVVSDGNN